MCHTTCIAKFYVTFTCLLSNFILINGNILEQTFKQEESSNSNTDQQFWKKLALDDLELALKTEWNTGRAKNVILFVGDGMGPNTVTATRINKVREEGYLSFEKFPHVGLLKTYSADTMVPDSASTATALFSGVKVNHETQGVDASVKLNDCRSTLLEDVRLKSLIILAKEAGMSTGFVTTMRVSHATPAALYAYSANRRWECETKLPPGAGMCKDISRQLIEDQPGRDINVIMGGGRQTLVFNVSTTPNDPLDTWSCVRKDGRNLIQEWAQDKAARSLKYAVVQNTGELHNVNHQDVDYLLGIFANGHMQYEYARDKTERGMPSLQEMTETAIHILQKNPKGYFLMVEGGNIDMAHHRGKAKIAITEAAALDDAVKKASLMVDPSNTLMIVTSDHSHTLTINGYARRGGDVFGIASASKMDKKNYTVLTYSSGGPASFQYTVNNNTDGKLFVDRRDPSVDNLTDYNYVYQSTILTDENLHGGNDIIVYAKGPYAHLFHNIHEQHYVMHVICYSAGLGDFHQLRNAGNLERASIIIISSSTPAKKRRGEETESAVSRKAHDTFWDCFDEVANENNTDQAQREERNVSWIFISSQCELPYSWWAANAKQYPNLTKFAKIYLSAPYSSVYSERLFSEAGLIYEEKRNRACYLSMQRN